MDVRGTFLSRNGFVVAVAGATGAVGREMLAILFQRQFPISRLVCLASKKSAGTKILFGGKECLVSELDAHSFEGVQVALFSAGSQTSKDFAPLAAGAGAVVIDNSSAWRMNPDVPLVVPEVNSDSLKTRPLNIIANPNCSTIQLCVALKPLHDAAKIKRIVISTYQAVSGKGKAAVDELLSEASHVLHHSPFKSSSQLTPPSGAAVEFKRQVFPAPMAFNVLSDWKGGESGYSEEECKVINETRKIFASPSLRISPTAVRVPVLNAHSESVNVEFERLMTVAEAKKLLKHAPGVCLVDEEYTPGLKPYPIEASGRDEVFVGRVREDLGLSGGIAMFIVSDNLRKGAALNAVQIAEKLSLMGEIKPC